VTRALLGIDLGTSSVKTIIVDADSGRVLGSASSGYPLSHPEAGAAEQDPEEWWQATVSAVQRATAEAGPESAIQAIGLSGQMHGTVLLDRQGEPVAPAIIWSDLRSAASAAALTSTIGRDHLLDIAGSPIAAGFQAATIHWLRQSRPELWSRTASVLLPKDYLRFRLTGDSATDPSDATATLLLDAQTRQWSPVLLDAVGVAPAQLPAIFASSAVTGELTDGAARELGLVAGIPVVGGAGDAAAAAVGSGVVDPSTLLLTLSSGAQALAPATTPAVDPEGRIHTFCSAFEPGNGRAGWNLMGATMSAGLALRWLRHDLFELKDDEAFEDLEAAANVPVGSDGLLFLPYLTGERTPHMNPDARGMFIGLGPEHGRPELTRAVLEGVAMALYDAFLVVRETGANPERIVLAGGGSRSPLWRQIIADLFGLPLVPLRIDEQSAYGAAILAASVTGGSPVDLARQWASYGNPVEPDATNYARYQQLHALFRETYTANAGIFDRLTAFRAGADVHSIPGRLKSRLPP